jgi:3-oxoacyl-[acyl-carrier protein] reductase
MIDPGLTDKVVAVTGANNPCGIGAAIARAFARQGAKILLHYFPVRHKGIEPTDAEGQDPGETFYYAQGAKGPDEVLASLVDLGAEASAWKADLSQTKAIPRLFEEAERTLGAIDVLVNNAAAWTADTFVPSGQALPNRTVEAWTDRPAQITRESFEKNVAVNTRAVALLMAEFASRHLAADRSWGRIINISTDGARCFPSEISYGASKLALEGFSRSAAAELGQFGITVNVISPGPIQTGWMTAEIERQAVTETPLGRIGQPEDVADVAVFLASEQARWVTGQLIHVGGGHRM